jgi:tetratricopeptide (TPR) repeat protein
VPDGRGHHHRGFRPRARRAPPARAGARDAAPGLAPCRRAAKARRRPGRARQPRRSRDAYAEALELEISPRERANLYYNRAEASLELDELEVAQADYRRAIELASDPDVFALARYGLAVALERLGDLPAALTEFDAAAAVSLPFPAYSAPDPLDLPGVFFVPAYERYYIEALRAMARLRHADSRPELLVESAVALQAWDAYLAAAPTTVPYRKNAEAHRRRVAESAKQIPSMRR